MIDPSALYANLDFLDEQYAIFRADPAQVSAGMRALFTSGELQPAPAPAERGVPLAIAARLGRVYGVVNAYRSRAHLAAKLDPLESMPRMKHPELDPRGFGFTTDDLDLIVPSGGLYGISEAPLREVLRRLEATYCRSIGVELMHISDPERRAWLEERIEPSENQPSLSREEKLHILDRLAAAEVFERFVHTKYVGTKRFSLEGGDSLIPLLDRVLVHLGRSGAGEAVIGMAHRGRLNVLANVMNKGAHDIFAEFEDIDPESVLGGGDVKYHMGFSSEFVTREGHPMHLSLAFNPSHLEAVDPVVVGRVRAKQRRRNDWDHTQVASILIHGDAAFAGQGLVAETLNLSELRGYRVGGTVHVIVNNQIGFTTSPVASRSTPYPTDVAKMIQVPIFHVNGDDPEAVTQAVDVAMDWRRRYRSDVVIDMVCFRRYGHNEGDEPSFTQPLLYQKIEGHPSARAIYARKLVEQAVVTPAEVDELTERRQRALEEELKRARSSKARPQVAMGGGYWAGYAGGADAAVPDPPTGVRRPILEEIGARLTRLPENFQPHPKIVRLLGERAKMGRGEHALDWGMAESLAFGSLAWEGVLVRLSGQDCRRGTFSHRHAVVVDVKNGEEWMPLARMREGQGEVRIYDSMLSEAAVLGFELGYSLDFPDGLVLWEAQFGDFSNGAQVIIDQFVSSAEDKWKRLSGLVLMLPHGYEGQGPEHSSARYERFLQLAAEDNLQVAQPTTPAQLFHLLRRQVIRKWRKPLVVLTPKSLLRLPEARSPLDALASGAFERVLDDPEVPDAGAVARVILCTGKVYYELRAERAKRGQGAPAAAIVRLEQLYPWRDEAIARVLARYPRASEVVWAQEEPANMGAGWFVAPRLAPLLGGRRYRAVWRSESASPATGSYHAHLIEEKQLMEQTFGPPAERVG